MKRTPRLGRLAGGILGLAVLALLAAYAAAALLGPRGGDPAARFDASDRALVARGAYLATLGDCAACHTAPGGRPYAGGLPIASPVGTIYATNITPDPVHGIGRYRYGDFERAVRRGIRRDGRTLYPAMPYPSFAHVGDQDMRALYAYFMHGVPPAAVANHAPDIAWPLSMRWPLAWWRWLFAPAVPAAVPQPPTGNGGASDALARGRYLVEGLGHCGSCHTPRGLGFQEKALAAIDGPLYLAGGFVDRHVANSLRGDDLTGLGRWSREDIVRFLRDGRNQDSAAFGGMREVVAHSTQAISETDLAAIAGFLKSLPPSGREPAYAYRSDTGEALARGDVHRRGALDYLNSCAACHLSNGRGYAQTFPALAGNPVVMANDPTSLINLVLNGSAEPGTASAPTVFTMPAFGDRLSDQEVADVVSFIRSSWGNRGTPVAAAQVAKLRAATGAPTPARRPAVPRP